MSENTLSVVDNRTGAEYTIPIAEGAIRATDLQQIKVSDEDIGLTSYDPSYGNTANCRSAVSYIDGDKGILCYRGYPIEQLARESRFLETAYLIIYGELPNQAQLDEWTNNITIHTMLHENIKQLMESFRYDAHPMGMLLSTEGALSTFYPDAKDVSNQESVDLLTYRAIAKMPTIAAFAYRNSVGFPYIYPDNRLSYSGNFLNMLMHPSRMSTTARIRCLRRLLTCCSSCMRSTSRTAARRLCAASAARGETRTRPWPSTGRHSMGRCTAVQARLSFECWREHRVQRQRGGRGQRGKVGWSQANGVRPPGVQ